jgi:hypothetical protein
MRPSLIKRSQFKLLTSFLLAALLFRAYVPVGFMPASGTPFLLEICSGQYPAPMASHHAHQHSGNHEHFEHCPFGSAPAAGPISHVVDFQPSGQISSFIVIDFVPLTVGVRLDRAHPPRGPPSLA